MRRIEADSTRVAYNRGADVLYVSFGPYDLTCLDHEDELDGGVFLQYAWPSGDLAGMEVWGFSKHYGSLPATIRVAGEEDYEFVIPSPEPVLA